MPSKLGVVEDKVKGNNIRKRKLLEARLASIAAKKARLIGDENVNPNILPTPSQTPSTTIPACRCSQHHQVFVTPTITSPKGVCLSCGNSSILYTSNLDVSKHDLIGNVYFHRDVHKDTYYTDIFQLSRDEMMHEIMCFIVKDDVDNNRVPTQENVQLRLGKLTTKQIVAKLVKLRRQGYDATLSIPQRQLIARRRYSLQPCLLMVLRMP